MASLREIRRKIQSAVNIQKITQAMELVAASRLRKAQAKAESSRPYALKIKEILDRLINASSDLLQHPLISHREVKKTGVVVIAADRGLCGGYNQSVFNAAEKFLQKYKPGQVELIPIGRKSVDYFQARKWTMSSKIEEWGGKITYLQIEEFTKTLMDLYLNGQLDEIWVIYTHFINVNAREVRLDKFLNINIDTETTFKGDYIFEPSAEEIFAEILPHYCSTKMQSILNDSYASELAARISAMRAATKNAEEMIEELTLERNKVRQSGITRELIEITSGAESLR
jgi:F-type H+-transporting ATPase subunit gamma